MFSQQQQQQQQQQMQMQMQMQMQQRLNAATPTILKRQNNGAKTPAKSPTNNSTSTPTSSSSARNSPALNIIRLSNNRTPTLQPRPLTVETAIKREWNEATLKWEDSMVKVQLEEKPFASGALRYAYKMWLIDADQKRIPAVAKIAKDPMESLETYMTDVQMQMMAKNWAERFNDKGVPKKVEFVSVYLIQFVNRRGRPVCAVEEFLEGKYERYNNNWDWCDDKRNTPQAFSHFTYEASNHELLICDIQGVGDKWTDPQIHTRDARGFGKGNKSTKGFDRFFAVHCCNAICRFLNLPLVEGSKEPKASCLGTPPPSWFISSMQKLIAQGKLEPSEYDHFEEQNNKNAAVEEDENNSKRWNVHSNNEYRGMESSLFGNVLMNWKDGHYIGQEHHLDEFSTAMTTSMLSPSPSPTRAMPTEQARDRHEDPLGDFVNSKLYSPRASVAVSSSSSTVAVSSLLFKSLAEFEQHFAETMSLVGVGIRLEGNETKGYTIDEISLDGPASECGQIAVGDALLCVDSCPLQGLPLSMVKQMVVGPAGSKVTLTIQRKSGKQVITQAVELVRSSARAKSVGIVVC